jgi:hypothetical protein
MLNSKNYDAKYLSSGLTYIVVGEEERTQFSLCMRVLAAASKKSNKLKSYLETLHPECAGKTPEFLNTRIN